MRCPYLYAIRIIGRKWSYPLLRSVMEPKTFSQVKRDLSFVTSRVLSNELRRLQTEKLVQKEGDLYCLTKAGWAFLHSFKSMAQWSAEFAGCKSCTGGLECANCPVYKNSLEGKDVDIKCACE